MDKDIDYIRLVDQARLGDKESLDHLVKLAQESLRDDVYRMSLDAHLTEDIVQETLLEMVKILGELKETDRFWPWLYKIALNKLRLHHRRQKVRRTVPMSEATAKGVVGVQIFVSLCYYYTYVSFNRNWVRFA
jgi:DNA-directed RNA polymerase specialized sigma24 family protein